MHKVIVLVDYANIARAASDKKVKIDWRLLLEYLASEREGRFLLDAFCYLPIDPRSPNARDRLKEQLALDGFVVRSKIGTPAGDTYKCDFDVEMTTEMVRIAHEIRPDILVLCTGDSDLAPVVEYMRAKGIRAEVAAFANATSREILLKCSSFISLDEFFDPPENSAEQPERPSDQPEPATIRGGSDIPAP